jgi:hypothetical protein
MVIGALMPETNHNMSLSRHRELTMLRDSGASSQHRKQGY